MAQALTGVRDLVNQAISQNNSSLLDKACQNAKNEPLSVEKCNLLIKGFCHFKNIQQAEAVLKEMKEASITPNLATCKPMIEASTTFEKAMKCFKVMQIGGLEAHVEVYNALIENSFSNGSREQIPALLKEMERCKIARNAATYALLLNGYCAVGFRHQFKDISVEMQNDGIVLGWQQYSEILDKLMALCEYTQSKVFVESMQQNQVSVKAVAKYGASYEAAVKSITDLESSEAINKALRQFLEHKQHSMIEAYLQTLPSLHFSTYKLVIVKCCEQGQMALAEALFLRMGKEMIKADLAIYNALLKGVGFDGDKIRAFLELMQQNLVAPNKETRGILEIAKLGHLLKGLSIT
jgi:leucine-rich PPR motif-containing protein